MRGSLLILGLALSFLHTTGAAYSDYGIVLSNTCLTMLKNNVSSNCPTYDQLLLLFPDTSDRKISGDFVLKDNIIQREKAPYKDHFEFYRYDDKDTMWIDPPADILEKIKLITITPYDFTYKIGKQVITNNTVIVGQSRYISPNCGSAILTANNYLFLLGDTMRFMKSNCNPSETNFDELKIRSWERTKHDITTSYKWQLDKWIKESKAKCVMKCFEY